MSEYNFSEAKEDIWLEDSLSTFSGLIFKSYTKVDKLSKDKIENGIVIKGKKYTVYRIVVSPVENSNVEIVTEVFRSSFERIKALRITDSSEHTYLKVYVEGQGKNKVVSWGNVKRV